MLEELMERIGERTNGIDVRYDRFRRQFKWTIIADPKVLGIENSPTGYAKRVDVDDPVAFLEQRLEILGW